MSIDDPNADQDAAAHGVTEPRTHSFGEKRKQQKTKAFWFFLATNVVFFAALIGLNRYGLKTDFFLLKQNSWKQVKELPGTPLQIAASNKGSLWVSHMQPDGVSRFDGSEWQNFRYQDIGFAPEEFYGELRPFENQLWLAVGSDVYWFDGRKWEHFKNVAEGKGIVTLSPGKERTWVIDDAANLYQFDGKAWKGSSLEEWGVKLTEDEKFLPDFRLAQANTGSLWLVSSESVWRFSEGWQQLLDSSGMSGTPTMLGSSGDVLWLSSGDQIIRIAESGKQLKRFSQSEFGLEEQFWFAPVRVTEQEIWIQRDQQIIAYNGTQPRLVQALPQLPEGYTNLFSLVIGSDGTIWAQAEAGGMFSSGTLVMGFLALWVLLSMAERAFKRKQQEQQKEHVKEVIGESVPSVETGGQLYIANTALEANEGVGAGSIIGRIARYTYNVVLYGAAFIAYPFISSGIDGLTGGMLPGWVKSFLVVFLAIFFISFLRIKIGSFWVLSPVNRGRYDKGLKRLHLARHFIPELAAVFETAILYYAGRYEESQSRAMFHLEQMKSQDSRMKSLILAVYATSLMACEKYLEAEKACEGALELYPESATIQCCLAETFLRRGQFPERAVELLDRAQENKGMSDASVRAEVLGNRAWALAASGRGAEAEEVLEQAFRSFSKKQVHDRAMLLYRAARTKALLGKAEEAKEQLQEARQIDFNGAAGSLAAKFLEREFRVRVSSTPPPGL